MNKKAALRPNFLTEALEEVSVKQNKSNATDEEKHLYALSKHAGYKILKSFVEDELRFLDEKNSEAISLGLSFEQLGYNSVVLDQVKKIVNRLFTRVEDAAEAINEQSK